MSKFARGLLAIVVVAFGVRVAYVAIAKSSTCNIVVNGRVASSYPSECLVGDQIFYNSEANVVARGKGFVEPLWSVLHPGQKAPPAADHPPLTVMVLTPVSWLLEHRPLSSVVHDPSNAHVREDRYTMVLLGTLLVFLIGLLGRRIGGDRVGLVAAAIAALNPNIWVNDGLVMSETITALTVVAAMLLALEVRDRPTWWRGAALGAVCGLAALARAELILLLPLLGIVVCATVRGGAKTRLTLTGVAVLAGVVVVAPWVGYNLARFKDPTFISTNDGIALAGSNCDADYYGAGIGLTSISGPTSCLGPTPPGDQSQAESVYRHRAFDYIENHEKRAIVVVAARVGRTWSFFRPLDMVKFNEGEGREPWVTRLGLVFYYPELIAALGGAVVLWRRRTRAVLWILFVPAIAATVGAAATYGQTRFRTAAEPSLAILAAVGVVALIDVFRRRAGRSGDAAAQAG